MLAASEREGLWEEFDQGNWAVSTKNERCRVVSVGEEIWVICHNQLVVRDILWSKPLDFEWDLLPPTSVDMLWSLGTCGVIVEGKGDWDRPIRTEVRQGEDVPSLGDTLKNLAMEEVVIGLGTFSGFLLFSGFMVVGGRCW